MTTKFIGCLIKIIVLFFVFIGLIRLWGVLVPFSYLMNLKLEVV